MMRAKFTPAIRNGKPSEAEIGVNYRIGRAYKEMMRRRELEATKTTNEPTIIEGGVLNGRALSLAKPVYPVSARSKRVSGTVSVSVLINENGKIVSAGAVNGPRELQDAARQAACKSKFSPTSRKGKSIRVSGEITYNFVAP